MLGVDFSFPFLNTYISSLELKVQGLSPQLSISSLATNGSQVTPASIRKWVSNNPQYFGNFQCFIIHFCVVDTGDPCPHRVSSARHTEHGLIITWARPGLQGLGTANPFLGHLGMGST
jgi:hypothetical protein